MFLEKDKEKKAKLVKILEAETLPPFARQMEHILSGNGGEFYIGKQVRSPLFRV